MRYVFSVPVTTKYCIVLVQKVIKLESLECGVEDSVVNTRVNFTASMQRKQTIN